MKLERSMIGIINTRCVFERKKLKSKYLPTAPSKSAPPKNIKQTLTARNPELTITFFNLFLINSYQFLTSLSSNKH